MAHCTKSNVDRVYVARQKGGRGLISSEMCVKTEENNLVWYVRNRPLALRSHVIFSAMLEGKQIGCYGKQWLLRGITISQLRKYLH